MKGRIWQIVGIFLCLFSMLACGKRVVLDVAETEILFGSTPEQVSQILGIDLEGVIPEKPEDYEVPDAEVYIPEKTYHLGNDPAEIELHFARELTPQGNPVGLTMIIFHLEQNADLGELVRNIEETYHLEQDRRPVYSLDENDEVTYFYWQKSLSEDAEEAARIETAMAQTFGERFPIVKSGIVMEGRVKKDGTVLISVIGSGEAIKNHIAEYE